MSTAQIQAAKTKCNGDNDKMWKKKIFLKDYFAFQFPVYTVLLHHEWFFQNMIKTKSTVKQYSAYWNALCL